MSKSKRRKQAPSATPWDNLDATTLTPAQALVHTAHKSAYAFRHESLDGDMAFFNQYERQFCPRCGSERIAPRGHDRSGIRRYRCDGCMKAFTPATGTVFESRKLPLSAWVDFLLQVFSFESMAVMTREDRRSDTTIPYWIAKVFSVLEGVQDGTVLTKRVQIDETYYPVPGDEAVEVDGKKLRGLSRNKICIGIGCDDSGISYYVREGLGKTSGPKTFAAFGTHIAPGSLLIHDMEKSHRKLVVELGLKEEVYNSKLLSKLDDRDNPLRDVNRLCFLLKRFLGSHSGFNRADIDGYLNLFSVMMNPPADKMEKAARVLDSAMTNPKTLRFRDLYNIKPSSAG